MNLAIVVMAAGIGTRMKSEIPKVLHHVCGRPMIEQVVETATKMKPKRLIVVVGHKSGLVKQTLKPNKKVEFVIQRKLLGTGDAVTKTKTALKDFKGEILILSGDTPLLELKTLKRMVSTNRRSKAAATLLIAKTSSPTGYGRIIRDSNGRISRIVEEKDATAAEKTIGEINTGTYVFNKDKLFKALRKISRSNKQKEYYLTDTIRVLVENSEKLKTVSGKMEEIIGINSRIELAKAEKIMRNRINLYWMKNGVTLIDPGLTFIDSTARIGRGTVIWPLSFLVGKTSVGKGCLVGPMVQVIDSKVGNLVQIQSSVVSECAIKDNVKIGPYCHLRPNTVVEEAAKVGAFVEIKKSRIGEGSKVPHLSYIGDASIGKDVNVGAGTITCNYDGVQKHKTIIENHVFLGSNTQLVAPVKIEEGAFTGSGSVISRDVPKGSLGIERNEQVIVKNWKKKRKKSQKKKV